MLQLKPQLSVSMMVAGAGAGAGAGGTAWHTVVRSFHKFVQTHRFAAADDGQRWGDHHAETIVEATWGLLQAQLSDISRDTVRIARAFQCFRSSAQHCCEEDVSALREVLAEMCVCLDDCGCITRTVVRRFVNHSKSYMNENDGPALHFAIQRELPATAALLLWVYAQEQVEWRLSMGPHPVTTAMCTNHLAAVRVVSAHSHVRWTPKLFCKQWFGTPVLVPAVLQWAVDTRAGTEDRAVFLRHVLFNTDYFGQFHAETRVVEYLLFELFPAIGIVPNDAMPRAMRICLMGMWKCAKTQGCGHAGAERVLMRVRRCIQQEQDASRRVAAASEAVMTLTFQLQSGEDGDLPVLLAQLEEARGSLLRAQAAQRDATVLGMTQFPVSDLVLMREACARSVAAARFVVEDLRIGFRPGELDEFPVSPEVMTYLRTVAPRRPEAVCMLPSTQHDALMASALHAELNGAPE